MKARLFLAVCLSVIATNIAVAQSAQGVIVNGLVVGEKYTEAQLQSVFGVPDSVGITEDGIKVLSYGNNRIYWYGEDSQSETERKLFWGVDIKDSTFVISEGVTVGLNKIYLPSKGTVVSSEKYTDGSGYVIQWRPKSLPESMSDAYSIMVYTNASNVIQSIVVHISM